MKQMKVMPVVTVNIETPHIYVNSSTGSFKKNIFVALQQTKRFANGTKIREFQEFVPCNQVKEQPGYIDIDYSELFYGNECTELYTGD